MNPGGSHPFYRPYAWFWLRFLGACIHFGYLPHRPWFRRLVSRYLVWGDPRNEASLILFPGDVTKKEIDRFNRWWEAEYASTR